MVIGYVILLHLGLYKYHMQFALPKRDFGYMYGFCAVFAYEHWLQYQLGLAERYPFLPLMLTSCYGAVGVVQFFACYSGYYSWEEMYKGRRINGTDPTLPEEGIEDIAVVKLKNKKKKNK